MVRDVVRLSGTTRRRTGIIALSAKNVYAIGNGNAEDEGGPTVVLHYNGSKWAKVAAGSFGYGTTNAGGSQIAFAES